MQFGGTGEDVQTRTIWGNQAASLSQTEFLVAMDGSPSRDVYQAVIDDFEYSPRKPRSRALIAEEAQQPAPAIGLDGSFVILLRAPECAE